MRSLAIVSPAALPTPNKLLLRPSRKIRIFMNICTVNAPSALLLRFAYYLANKNYAPALLHMHTPLPWKLMEKHKKGKGK